MEAAFFDLDKTVIAKAAMLAFGPHLRRAGLLNRWLLVRALWGQLVFRYLGADEDRMEKMRRTALRVCTGWHKDKISSLVDETLSEVIDPLVFDEAVELIVGHRLAGRRIYLVSASPEEIVRPLARHLGVDAAIASRARIDDDGRYTGEIEFYAAGASKVAAMEAEARANGLDLERSFAYSDSVTDLPMLEAVGHPVAVNPDRGLLRVALERDWDIRVFERPRPLSQQRAKAATPAAMAGVASLTAAFAVGAALWWRGRRTTRRRWSRLRRP